MRYVNTLRALVSQSETKNVAVPASEIWGIAAADSFKILSPESNVAKFRTL